MEPPPPVEAKNSIAVESSTTHYSDSIQIEAIALIPATIFSYIHSVSLSGFINSSSCSLFIFNFPLSLATVGDLSQFNHIAIIELNYRITIYKNVIGQNHINELIEFESWDNWRTQQNHPNFLLLI